MNEGTRHILNRNIMIDLIGDEPDLIKQFEIDFLNQAKISLQNIADMYNTSRLHEIKEEAHFLKTSAKAVGAEQISHLLQALEVSGSEHNKPECRELILKTKVALQQIYGVISNDK
ncbi:Hpt domain-containing protein [Shewanella psychrophila]|uniref:Hpt domain-containing protein n=1 Tax=Shewanella psychrophila TaxID=225848 RepID=A0A1S6HW99_9GAMM|nr:Hpt domain-containing protein [Shewanella psychrophila]AQS39704.1 Hpt domain-containing protein [Shewanella psychrophila]